MNLPCPEKITCPCGDDSPLANLSAEAPDLPVFIRPGYVRVVPPLGAPWGGLDCLTLCASEASPEAAALCAQVQALFCVGGQITGPGPVPPHPAPAPVSPTLGAPYGTVYNTMQECTVECPDGTEFTYTVPAGLFGALLTAGNAGQLIANQKARSYACAQAPLHRICLSEFPARICAVDFAQLIITATGGFLAGFNESNTWSIAAGAIPPGMNFYGDVPARGQAELQGNPTTPGVYNFTVEVIAPNGDYMLKPCTLVVAGLVAQPPPGTVGNSYDHLLLATGFENAPEWSLDSGSLPDGLTLALNGEISGTPTTAQSTNALVRMFDPVTRFTCTENVGMTIQPAGDILCCNCGAGAKIVGFDPTLFTFNPAAFLWAASVTFDNIQPLASCPPAFFFCTDNAGVANIGFSKSGGQWFAVAPGGGQGGGTGGVCTVAHPGCNDAAMFNMTLGNGDVFPGNMVPCDNATIVSCYAGDPSMGTFDILTHPYDLAYGNGAWDGKFTLTDSFGNGSCASQWFACNHINGWGYFGIELDQTPDGPNFDWTFTIFGNPPVEGLTPAYETMWQGTLINSPTQNGVYTRVGGTMTGPPTLTIGPN